jgi:hypothetical protein
MRVARGKLAKQVCLYLPVVELRTQSDWNLNLNSYKPMWHKQLLWVEVDAHAVCNRSKCGGVGWAGAGVAWRLGVCVVFEAFLGCLASLAFFVWCSPAGGCVQSTADF